jgi:hypothetical protein
MMDGRLVFNHSIDFANIRVAQFFSHKEDFPAKHNRHEGAGSGISERHSLSSALADSELAASQKSTEAVSVPRGKSAGLFSLLASCHKERG